MRHLLNVVLPSGAWRGGCGRTVERDLPAVERPVEGLPFGKGAPCRRCYNRWRRSHPGQEPPALPRRALEPRRWEA